MNNGGSNKERKRYLAKRGKIKCGRCPYHQKDNVSRRKRRAREDRYKDHREGQLFFERETDFGTMVSTEVNYSLLPKSTAHPLFTLEGCTTGRFKNEEDKK